MKIIGQILFNFFLSFEVNIVLLTILSRETESINSFANFEGSIYSLKNVYFLKLIGCTCLLTILLYILIKINISRPLKQLFAAIF